MLLRLFRIIDRLGRISVKATAQASHYLIVWLQQLSRRAMRRTAREAPVVTDLARSESQIRSLSGLIVILLASVVFLILWGTGPQSSGNPVIRLLSVGNTPGPAGNPEMANAGSGFRGNGETVVFSMRAGAYSNLFALSSDQSTPTRITATQADDRDPAWSPDGLHIAFASRRDGNWELYVLNVATGEIKRLTYDLAYEAHPTWSPDSLWIAYEGYAEGNLDIYIISADGTAGPFPVTRNGAADFSPAWTTEPGGRTIAYVSTRDGQQDIYTISLDDPNDQHALNLTLSADINEDSPTWSPDGTVLAYSAVEQGTPLVYVITTDGKSHEASLLGQGAFPAWSPDGKRLAFAVNRPQGSLLLTGQFGAWDTSVQAFALPSPLEGISWSAASLPQPLQGSVALAATTAITPVYDETIMADKPEGASYRLMSLPGVIGESQPFLSDRTDASFLALKDYVNRASGWDLLGRLGQVWWPLDRPVEPGQSYQSWHKAGRAFDIIQNYNQGNPAQIELVSEQIGPDVVWRLYVRAAVQDGSLGEPLRQLPWDFAARTSGDVSAYEAGGRPKGSVPAGYYVDFTRAAEIFGWYRAPADPSWRYNWPGVMYWQYEKRDGLDWWSAMLELYPEATLRQTFSTPTSLPPEFYLTATALAMPQGSPSPGTAAPGTAATKKAPTRTPSPTRTPTP